MSKRLLQFRPAARGYHLRKEGCRKSELLIQGSHKCVCVFPLGYCCCCCKYRFNEKNEAARRGSAGSQPISYRRGNRWGRNNTGRSVCDTGPHTKKNTTKTGEKNIPGTYYMLVLWCYHTNINNAIVYVTTLCGNINAALIALIGCFLLCCCRKHHHPPDETKHQRKIRRACHL